MRGASGRSAAPSATPLTLRLELLEPSQVIPVHALNRGGGPRPDAGDELPELPHGGGQVHIRIVRVSRVSRQILRLGVSGRIQIAFFIAFFIGRS